MTPFRFRIWIVALIAACSQLTTHAQDYPVKPIRILVPYPPGGNPDNFARLAAEILETKLRQPVIVENKPGAGSILATQAVARAEPDGYTMLLAASALTTNPALYKRLPYDTEKDLRAVAVMGSSPVIVVASPQSGFRSIADVTGSRGFSYGSPGNGTIGHLTGIAWTTSARLRAVHIPYKGTGPAQTDLVGGHIQVMFDNLNTALPLIKSGRVTALALAAPKRSELLPDVPTLAEVGHRGFDATSWFGLVAPRKTPDRVVAMLNDALVAGLAERRPTFTAFKTGAEPGHWQANAFDRFLASETVRWASIITRNQVTPD